MSCIHPAQIQAINQTFSPTAEEIDYCQKVLQAFEEANARGDGSIAFGGQLIDRPIVERARRTIEMAKSLNLTLINTSRGQRMRKQLGLALVFVWSLTTAASTPDRMTPVKITDGVYMLAAFSRTPGNSTVGFHR